MHLQTNKRIRASPSAHLGHTRRVCPRWIGVSSTFEKQMASTRRLRYATFEPSASAIWRGTTRPWGAPARGALALGLPRAHINYPEKVALALALALDLDLDLPLSTRSCPRDDKCRVVIPRFIGLHTTYSYDQDQSAASSLSSFETGFSTALSAVVLSPPVSSGLLLIRSP